MTGYRPATRRVFCHAERSLTVHRCRELIMDGVAQEELLNEETTCSASIGRVRRPGRRRLRGCSGPSDRTQGPHRRREPLENCRQVFDDGRASLRHILAHWRRALRKSSALTSDACRGRAAWRDVCTSLKLTERTP